MRLTSLFDEGDSIANTKTILEEEGAAEALKVAVEQDTDTVSEHIRFVHKVSGKYDDLVFLLTFEKVPKTAASSNIHACGGLIK